MKVKIGKFPNYRFWHRWFNIEPEQKIEVKIDPWDTWSMDYTLAHIIVPMLKQLKATKHGAPNTDDDDVPEHLRSTSAPPKKYDWDVDEFHFKRWDWVLEEMIWAFEQKIDEEWDAQYYGPWIPPKEGEVIGDFEWIDTEGRDKHHDRIKNGLRLFGKYYEALWD